MTAPVAPTTTTICTEALTRFYNGGAPTAAEITRAESYGFEKVKRDLMNIGKTWRPLLKTVFDITKSGVSHYANPSDYEKDFSVSLMSGSHTGVLGTVTSQSVVDLAATEDVTQREMEGKYLLITSGTGVDQAQICDDYSITTKRATMASAYDTLCVTGDGYLVVSEITPLRIMPLAFYDKYSFQGLPGTPTKHAYVPNQTVGEIALYPTPNAVFGLLRRYYADLMKLDTSSTLYSTILRRWASIFEQGVYVWKLGEDDDRYQAENQIYQNMLMAAMGFDLDGFDASKLKAQ